MAIITETQELRILDLMWGQAIYILSACLIRMSVCNSAITNMAIM